MCKYLVKCCLFLFILFFGCQNPPNNADNIALFEYKSTAESGLIFANRIVENDTRGIGMYDYFYNGAGLACGDFDNDGLTDVFFAGNDTQNGVFKNLGQLKFQDKTPNSGIKGNSWSTGVTTVDINADGLLDIYVCNSGPFADSTLTKNQLYINTGNFQFKESASEYGIDDISRSSQAVFFDMDNDGDLDLWVMNHSLRNHGSTISEWNDKRKTLRKWQRRQESNTLYENNNGRYIDISEKAGILNIGFGLGINVSDINSDGFLDVHITNDYFVPDFIFINNGNGTFTESVKDYCAHTSYYSMGTDAADINNDGHTDLVVVDMTPGDHVRNKTLMASMNVGQFNVLTDVLGFLPQYMFNSLLINNGNAHFSDIAHFAKVATSDWSWAPLLADFDNDGWKDLYITNGFYRDTKHNDWTRKVKEVRIQKGKDYTLADYNKLLKEADQVPISNQIFKNIDGYNFEEKTVDWNIDQVSFSNGAAYGDFDNDGDLDLIVNNLEHPVYLIENKSSEIESNNYIQFSIDDSEERTFSFSSFCIYTNDEKQCSDYSFTRGYLSSMQKRIHFGLADIEKVDSLVITAVSGQSFVLKNPAINKHHILSNIAQLKTEKTEPIAVTMLRDVTDEKITVIPEHQERAYNEYAKEVLLPHSQSKLGPSLAVGDIDGNGLEDFYFGGSYGQNSAIYYQQNNGNFRQKLINDDSDIKVHGAKLLDVDGDKDLDLYVACGGGSEMQSNPSLLQDRLYINDGKGVLKYEPHRLPSIISSTKTIIPIDWDGDNDLDLFVGGRNSPGKYPISPKSYFLENNNGVYQDESEAIASSCESLGMVTSGVDIDLDRDGTTEIILVGEWMPVTILKLHDSKFEMSTLPDTEGWWQSIEKGDLDNDGDDDLVLGNIGLNNKFHPTIKKPLHVYANDFDQTGTLDIVLSKEYKGELVPVRGKECSTEQMPFISDKFESYSSFANASMTDIFGANKLKESVHHTAKTFASTVLINENGTLTVLDLPNEAQLAPINGIIIQDFNEDGKNDIMIAGNIFDTEVETTPYDSGNGLILLNNMPSGFRAKSKSAETGIMLTNNVKDIKIIQLGKDQQKGVLVANNNSRVQLLLKD